MTARNPSECRVRRRKTKTTISFINKRVNQLVGTAMERRIQLHSCGSSHTVSGRINAAFRAFLVLQGAVPGCAHRARLSTQARGGNAKGAGVFERFLGNTPN